LKITGFAWIDDVVEKLARKHQVEYEVEELIHGGPRVRSSRRATERMRMCMLRSARQKQEDI
jgi:hypothetical protein